ETRPPDHANLRPEAGPVGPESTVGLLANERDGARAHRTHAILESVAVEVAATQVARSRSRAVRGVRQPVSQLEKRELLLRLVEPRREPRVVEQPPEVVARVREVRCGRRRDTAGVDSAEDADEARREDVRNGGGGGGSSGRFGHAACSVARAASTSPCRPTSWGAAAPGGGWRQPVGGAARARSGSGASRRLRLRPARVEQLLEPFAELLSTQRGRTAVLGEDAEEADPLVTASAVAPGVAFGLGERPEPHRPEP